MNLIAAVSAAANFLFGGAGGVTLGGLALSDMEVPERIAWGGRQQVAVHKFPGGARVIDAMGQDDKPLEWSGYFRGASAVSRAVSFDAIRIAGAPVTLTWGTFSRQVIVTSFECESANGGFLLPYRISCEVIPAPLPAAALGLLGEIQADISTALADVVAFASPVLVPLQAALSGVSASLPIAGALSGGSAAFLNVASTMAIASSAVGLAVSSSDLNLAALITVGSQYGNVIGANSGAGGAAALISLGSAAGTVATTQQARGYVGRSVANMNGASQ